MLNTGENLMVNSEIYRNFDHDNNGIDRNEIREIIEAGYGVDVFLDALYTSDSIDNQPVREVINFFVSLNQDLKQRLICNTNTTAALRSFYQLLNENGRSGLRIALQRFEGENGCIQYWPLPPAIDAENGSDQ